MRALALAGLAAMLALPAVAQTPPEKVAPKPFGIVGAPSGTGPYPAVAAYRADKPLHTIYHPATLPRVPMPILLWGNGGCRDNGLSAAQFLREVSSHGYFVVTVGPPREERAIGAPQAAPAGPPMTREQQLASRGPDATSAEQLIEGLDWATAMNADPKSPFYRRLDPARVAVMGHSCGGLQAIKVSADPRIKATVLFNSGVYNGGPASGVSALSIGKDALDRLHAPIAYIIGGPGDIAWPNAIDDVSRITRVPVFFAHAPIGHSGTFWTAPNGGKYGEIATAWLDAQLRGNAKAAAMFRGYTCGLCKTAGWSVIRPLP